MLNPLRAPLSRSAAAAHDRPSPFAERAAAELAGFRALKSDLEGQVRRGDLTVKVARERAAAAAAEAKVALARQADGYSPTPRAFLDRIVEAVDARRRAGDSASLESLQRETNRLLRRSLVEQQLATRAAEFEARTFSRPMAGGDPAPTLDGLLALATAARDGGDEAAAEWSRRQLEAFRAQVHDPADLRRIDRACDRPDAVNLRLVETYVRAMEGRPLDDLTRFVDGAIADEDANACVAAFALARGLDPAGDDPAAAHLTRRLLAGVPRFPDAALATLRAWEADARAGDAEAARAQVDLAAARLDAESRLPGLAAPTAEELDRLGRVAARPEARPGEAIGLNLSRRGHLPGDPEPAIATDMEV